MIIVSDTSPINYLVLIDEIDSFGKLFERVIIPTAVLLEMQHPRTPPQVARWVSQAPSWLEVRPVHDSTFIPQKRLGEGERQAIALAIELSADALLIDDRDGILEARRHDLVTLGTFSLLERAAEKNLLDLADALSRLRQTSFRLPPLDVLEAMLARDKERMTGR